MFLADTGILIGLVDEEADAALAASKNQGQSPEASSSNAMGLRLSGKQFRAQAGSFCQVTCLPFLCFRGKRSLLSYMDGDGVSLLRDSKSGVITCNIEQWM
jgi:hypothetical protein